MQYLDDLVSQAESIATNLEDDEVPHIHRNVEHLRLRGEKSLNRAAQNDIKAAKLLGNKIGYELSSNLSKTLENLNVIPAYDGSSGVNIEDIPSFLKNERVSAILSSINLARNNTLNMSYKLCNQAKSDWWKQEKTNIMNLLINCDKLPHLMPNVAGKLSIGNSENERQTRTTLSREESQYAREIARFIDNELSHGELRESASLAQLLLHSDSSPLNERGSSELAEISRLVSRYYQSRIANADSDINEAQILIDAALGHLESEYLAYANQYVSAALSNDGCDIRRSMEMFVEHNLLGSLDTSGLEDGCVNGVPVWPMIFACVRAGLHREAVAVARQAVGNLGEFHSLLDAWSSSSGALPMEQARRLATEYKRHVRASGDSYKRLMYILMMAGDVNEEGHSLSTVDDFLWLRLSQLRRHRRASADVVMDQLRQLQALVADEYGEAHFQANQHPVTYCRILLLCQLMEPALAFLARFDQLRCHSVHLALLMWQAGLVSVTGDPDAALLTRSNDEQTTVINLARLVAVYTRQFQANHPRNALDLFFLLRHIPTGAHEPNAFVTCATNLAVEGGQIELLFGGGSGYQQGLLARYEVASDGVLESVARRLRQMGKLEAACDVLQLTGRIAEATSDLAELLINATCSSLPGDHPTMGRLQSKAEYFLARLDVHSDEWSLLSCVLAVTRFLSSAGNDANSDFEAALAALDRTQLLPVSSDVGTIRSATEVFRNLPELVRSLFPNLLVVAMRTLRGVAKNRHHSPDSLIDIRRRAAALITFTGQLPYRMPSDVYANLSQLEMDIN